MESADEGCFWGVSLRWWPPPSDFVVRAMILDDWRAQFNLSGEQIGYLVGAGLYPFAISIILFSLVVDRIGYGVSMVLAFAGHLASAVITIFAGDFSTLYLGTFLFALSNGIVEAVINPVVATIYDKQKTHYLSVLHAGWPGGLVLGGLLAMTLGTGGHPGRASWQSLAVEGGSGGDSHHSLRGSCCWAGSFPSRSGWPPESPTWTCSGNSARRVA